jgi:hypothetical protein
MNHQNRNEVQMSYEFNKTGETANYEIKIDTAAYYGYFEHKTLGDERSGGLWFLPSITSTEGDMGDVIGLTDYDGVSELPKQVIAWLREQGIFVDEDFE